MAKINENTYTSNFDGDKQLAPKVKLLTSERGHYWPLNAILEGEVLGDGLKVKVTTPSGMSVTITPGTCRIPYDDYAYDSWLDKEVTLPIESSDQNLNRYSYIVAYIDRNKQYPKTVSDNPGLMVIAEVKGTAKSDATTPNEAQIESVVGVGNPYIILALVHIPANTSAILDRHIDLSLRKPFKFKDGIVLPRPSFSDGIRNAKRNEYLPIKVAVINRNEALPQYDPNAEILVCELMN